MRPTTRRPIRALRATAGRIRHPHSGAGRPAEYAPYLLHRRPEALAPVGAVSSGGPADDRILVERIVAAYRAAAEDFRHDRSSMWAGFFEQHHEGIHDALIAGDVERVAAVLRDPAGSNLFYGFDGLGPASSPELDPYWDYLPLFVLDHLVRFAEAIGALRLDYPEGYLHRTPRKYRTDDVLDRIEDELQLQLSFPAPFAGERGIESSRGLIAYRAVDALYQAWRVAQLLPGAGRVVEIGAGLGRTAYYARLFGIDDYTLVDLPLTGISQAYLLGRILDPPTIVLHGENPPDPEDAIKISPPHAFLNGTDRYDLVLNVDSLPEVGRATAEAYIRQIGDRTPLFLSINHEANDYTVRELLRQNGTTTAYDRYPYWMRPGYTEELVRFS